MKIFRIVCISLSWIGILGLILGIWGIGKSAFFDLTYTPGQLRGPIIHGWDYFFVGLVLSTIFGIIGKPRFMWHILVVVGITCFLLVIIDATAQNIHFNRPISVNMFKLIMIIICIMAGLIIRFLRNRLNQTKRRLENI
jgi:hypothetical protein